MKINSVSSLFHHQHSGPVPTVLAKFAEFAGPVPTILLGLALVAAGCGPKATVLNGELFEGEEPSMSPDGTKIVFQRYEQGTFRVVVRDLKSGGETRVREDEGYALHPRWTPNGAIVYTFGNEIMTAFEGIVAKIQTGYNLWSYKAGENRQLTSGRWYDYQPTFAPDGSIYYVTTENAMRKHKPGEPVNWSYLMRRTPDGKRESVYEIVGWVNGVEGPSISPNSQYIVWSQMLRFGDPFRIVGARLHDVNNCAYLTPKTMYAVTPRWHPDGVHLVFAGYQSGDPGWGVYLMNAAGGAMKRIADGRNPAFSSDGRTLLWDRGGKVWARPLVREDIPSAEPVKEIADNVANDILTLKAKIRYQCKAEQRNVTFVPIRAKYPEHDLGLQLIFKDNTVGFATRWPTGGYALLTSKRKIKSGETLDIVGERLPNALKITVNGVSTAMACPGGLMKLTGEAKNYQRQRDCPGELVEASIVRSPAPKVFTRKDLFRGK